MPKSLCNHELSIIVIVVCDQFFYTHTKSKKVPSLNIVALSYNFIFACTRNLSFETCYVYNIVIYQYQFN